MTNPAFQSAKRIAIASAIAIPACVALTGVMFIVPAMVCIASLFAGLVAFIVGADFCVQSKPLAMFGGVTVFAALLASVFRGLLG